MSSDIVSGSENIGRSVVSSILKRRVTGILDFFLRLCYLTKGEGDEDKRYECELEIALASACVEVIR